MKRLHDQKQIEDWLKRSNISSYFSTPDLKFLVLQYQKGEFVTSANQKLDNILFVVDGVVRIYGLRENGTISPVNQLNAPIILGDMEFSQQQASSFFTEAVTEVTCIALPIQQYEEQLHSDILFLHALLRSYAAKMKQITLVEIPSETIEERVILYLKNFCPTHELIGIEAATLQLRCSRRQLQRVLQKLCAEGKVNKTGKGRYKLTHPHN